MSEDQERYSFQMVVASDKNLALAGLRIEIEKHLKEIAEANGIGTKMQSVGRLLNILSERQLIGWDE